MEGKRININSDFRPLGVFFSLSYWNALFSPYLTGIFKGFEEFSLKITIVLISILTLILAAIFDEEATSLQVFCSLCHLHHRINRDDIQLGYHLHFSNSLWLPLPPDRSHRNHLHGRHCLSVASTSRSVWIK